MSDESKNPQDAGQLEGHYANYLKIGHNAFEFLLDFGQFYPESQKEQFHTRIVTSPFYARAMLEALRESFDQYEQTFGAIPSEPSKKNN